MRIDLPRDYCGRIINDKVLLKGVQDVEDSVGAYLVGKGYAVDLTPDLPQAVDSEPVFEPLPEITEDVVTEERTSSPVSRNKKRR